MDTLDNEIVRIWNQNLDKLSYWSNVNRKEKNGNGNRPERSCKMRCPSLTVSFEKETI